ncbi:hypothetical protein C8R46DRAFT_1174657 [Mycena filopes]|nr:hypothetical protein C8R46DRAFT_1174657 [Mycena filopes]
MAPPSLISRLYKDLAELHESPYPGVVVFTDDSDVRNLCLVLTPPSGPWTNLSLHFDVKLPDDWPLSPPKVSSSVNGIDHPNLFGSYVCCDLLKTKAEIYRGDGYTGGYSPALTLRGLFLQFLTFFSSTKAHVGDCIRVRYYLDEEPELVVARRGQVILRLGSGLPNLSGRSAASTAPSARPRLTQDDLAQAWEEDPNPVVVMHEEMTASAGPGSTRVHQIEQLSHRWTSTHRAIRTWKCGHCPYGTAAVPHFALDSTPPAVCQLGLLNDDVLYEIAQRLPSESLISFSAAYPRLHDIVHSTHVLLQRELRCFFLRSPLSESILGIGVAFDPRARTLSSDFDWLSERAFDEFGVRESVEKRDFAFFLPLAFSRPHFERAYASILKRLGELDAAVQKAENTMSRNPRRPAQRYEVVGVVYRMMNNIVVSLMKSCDTALSGAQSSSSKTLLHASEKAVVAYCHLFHLVLCLCRADPSLLRDATLRLRRFIARKDARVKAQVPDLGELIIPIMLVLCRPPVGGGPAITWSALAGPFLEEVLIRNVRWVLKDAPELEVMERGASDYRLAETFARSRTSLRLVSFQITFLDLFFKAYGSNISRLDANYGFPEKELPERMVGEVKEIYKISTWPAFFARVRFSRGVSFGKEKFSDMLREAVKTSATRRYHNALSRISSASATSILPKTLFTSTNSSVWSAFWRLSGSPRKTSHRSCSALRTSSTSNSSIPSPMTSFSGGGPVGMLNVMSPSFSEASMMVSRPPCFASSCDRLTRSTRCAYVFSTSSAKTDNARLSPPIILGIS